MKKLYLLVVCVVLAIPVSAQTKKRNTAFNKVNDKNDLFLQKQWWIGLKGGANLTKANVQKMYSIIAPTNYPAASTEKSYRNFKELGSAATLEITFYVKGISLSFQPTFQHTRFSYTNTYQWFDQEVAVNRVELEFDQQQQLNHAVLPLIIKYEIAADRFRPYIQAGGYTAHLLNATKAVTVSGTDYASGGANVLKSETIAIGATDLFAKNHWGLLAGAGAYYNLGNIRLNLDISYRLGMSSIVSGKNRYGSDRLSGVGDSLDDLTMNTLAISAGTLFPLRFLSRGFKSLDKK
jgi:hypothetical protein